MYIDENGQKIWFGTGWQTARIVTGVLVCTGAAALAGYDVYDLFSAYQQHHIGVREAQRNLVEILLSTYAFYSGKKGILTGIRERMRMKELEQLLGRELRGNDYPHFYG